MLSSSAKIFRWLPQSSRCTTTLSGGHRSYMLGSSQIGNSQILHRIGNDGKLPISQQTECAAASTATVVDAGSTSTVEGQEIHRIDLRVGKILSVEQHPEADELYVEQIDLGEPEPRTIISGLRNFLAMEDLQGRSVIVVSNLKPRSMRGIKSSGMLLCASNSDHTVVDPLTPPRDACVGERVFFGQGGEAQAEAASPNQVQKKKLWEACQPLLSTDEACAPGFRGIPMLTSAGPVTSTLSNAKLS